ncbi:MAG: ATP-dependent RecD-like DNA helicase, partial [Chloroflexota bacterium]
SAVQERLTPTEGPSALGYASKPLYRGDRIMVIKNQYDLDVMNGDVGTIIRIDVPTGKGRGRIQDVTVRLDNGKTVVFPARSHRHLTLCYAISVHRSQGSEYPYVIIPFDERPMMDRQLLYTALTRAKKGVVFVATSMDHIAAAIRRDASATRFSTLDVRLRHLLADTRP